MAAAAAFSAQFKVGKRSCTAVNKIRYGTDRVLVQLCSPKDGTHARGSLGPKMRHGDTAGLGIRSIHTCLYRDSR